VGPWTITVTNEETMKFRQEEEDVDVEKGKRITPTAETTPPPQDHPEALTSPSG